MREITQKELKDLLFLDCLLAYGVDNWENYDDAWNLFREEYSKESEE